MFSPRLGRILVKEALWMRKAVGSTYSSRTGSSQQAPIWPDTIRYYALRKYVLTATRWQLGARQRSRTSATPSVVVNRSAN